MKLQQVLSHTRKAIDDFNMIQDGDKIAIGISGGKDSLCLLYALHGLKRFYPKKFDIIAITVDLGFGNLNLDKIVELCKQLDVEYHVVKTDIAKIIFEDRKESNPCALCAKMRRGALNSAIVERGYTKLALGHHQDDVVLYRGGFAYPYCFTAWTRITNSALPSSFCVPTSVNRSLVVLEFQPVVHRLRRSPSA